MSRWYNPRYYKTHIPKKTPDIVRGQCVKWIVPSSVLLTWESYDKLSREIDGIVRSFGNKGTVTRVDDRNTMTLVFLWSPE